MVIIHTIDLNLDLSEWICIKCVPILVKTRKDGMKTWTSLSDVNTRLNGRFQQIQILRTYDVFHSFLLI